MHKSTALFLLIFTGNLVSSITVAGNHIERRVPVLTALVRTLQLLLCMGDRIW